MARDQRLPEVPGVVAVFLVHVDHAGVAPGAEPRHPFGQVDADAAQIKLRRLAPLEAQLVQPRARAHQDREGLRRDLHIDRPVIAVGHVIEGRAVIGEQADKDVHPARGALGIGPGGDAGRQGQRLLQLGDIDAALFQHRALGQVQLVHGHVLEPLDHLAAEARQEGGPDPPGADAQAQVETGGLHLVWVEGAGAGDRALGDQGVNGLAGQDSGRELGVCHRRDTRRWP